MNKKLIICIGIPCSGKSTWSKEYLLHNSDTIRVNRDDLRLMLRNSQVVDQDVEVLMNRITYEIISEASWKAFDVVVDNTHCTLKFIKELINEWKGSDIEIGDFEIHLKIFKVDLVEAKRRNFIRYKTTGVEIPEDVIEKFYQRFNSMINSPEFKELTTKYNTEWIG